MTKLRRGTFLNLEDIVRDYPQMDNYIKHVEEELLNPWQEQDTNVGGGRSSLTSAPTERKAITIATDKHLRLLKERKAAMDKVWTETRDETKKIIRMWYWENPRTKTWDGIAEECHFSRKYCIVLRDDLIHRLALELGETAE